jgi:hypothetical protein
LQRNFIDKEQRGTGFVKLLNHENTVYREKTSGRLYNAGIRTAMVKVFTNQPKENGTSAFLSLIQNFPRH